MNRRAPRGAEPRWSSINSGMADSSTGERGKRDAIATAADAGRLLGLETKQALVLSTGVIGIPCRWTSSSPGVTRAAGPSRGRRSDAAEAIMTTDTSRRTPRRAVRLRRRRDGKGLRDDPSRPGHDALGHLHRLSARTGRGDRVLRPAVERSSTRSPWTATAPRTTRSSCSRTARGHRADAESDSRSRPRCSRSAPISRGQIVADGEGVTVLAEINGHRRRRRLQAKAIAKRIATSALVKTALFGHDANWGRVPMAAG